MSSTFSVEAASIDVLIVGSGPSGLMLSTWLARLGIKTRIVDRRFSRLNSGQADGLQSRTFEIFDSLGFGQAIWREANHMLEIRFWNPDNNDKLYRSDWIVDTKPGLSRFQQATLHQARIEDYLLGYVRQHSDIKVEYGVVPELLRVDTNSVEKDEAYPVEVCLRHLVKDESFSSVLNGPSKGSVPNGLFRSNLRADITDEILTKAKEDTKTRVEMVRAKYVVGCDGAHSWTRRQIGSVLEGEQTDFIWGVLDIIPITDFPDIRYRCAIHSAHGSMMVIPRENKYVRLYIQITEVDSDGNTVDRFAVSPDTLLGAANKILSPYKLSYEHCHWWTAYRIGQRVGSKFSAHGRVFLAGDAVHTHSPKAGQGMNISMHDTYNLGWKLASVIKGQADRSLLATYDTERRQIAQELIDFDHQFSRLFSKRPNNQPNDDDKDDGVNLDTFKKVFDQGNLFASGCAVDYDSNLIVAKGPGQKGSSPFVVQLPSGTRGSNDYDPSPSSASRCIIVGKQALAANVLIGMRMPSCKVLNQSDARPWHLQELLPSTGAWRILVFPGDISRPELLSRYEALGEALDLPSSFLRSFAPETASAKVGHGVFEILTIHAAPRHSVELLSLPDVFHPYDEKLGWDYWKVFVDDESYHEGHGHAYENYGIDPSRGCLIVVRPDQYVSWVGEMEDLAEINSFFGSFMRSRPQSGKTVLH